MYYSNYVFMSMNFILAVSYNLNFYLCPLFSLNRVKIKAGCVWLFTGLYDFVNSFFFVLFRSIYLAPFLSFLKTKLDNTCCIQFNDWHFFTYLLFLKRLFQQPEYIYRAFRNFRHGKLMHKFYIFIVVLNFLKR